MKGKRPVYYALFNEYLKCLEGVTYGSTTEIATAVGK